MTNSSDDEVKIIKADYDLKVKVGGGGFSPAAVAAAEKRMDEAKTLFPSIAARDLEEIEQIIEILKKEVITQPLLLRVHAAATELELHSQMFQYPLVAAVGQSLRRFCEEVKTLSHLVNEIIALHLKTLQIAIQEGPRAITEKDRIELLNGLEKACKIALNQK